MSIWVIRAAGLILAATGAALLLIGGPPKAIDYRGISIPIPLHFLLMPLGLTVAIFPIGLLQALSLFGPEAWRDTLKRIISESSGTTKQPHLSGDLGPEDFATAVNAFIQDYFRRYYLTLTGICLVFALTLAALPFLVADLVANSNYRRYAELLSREVQESNLDADNIDHFHAAIETSRPALENPGRQNAVAPHLLRDLEAIFEPAAKTPKEIRDAVSDLYRKRVEPMTEPETGLVRISALNSLTDEPGLDPPEALPSYLTLLAYLAISQGHQGQYVEPYLQARQFLARALSIAENRNLNLPSTHNMMGLSFASLLISYDKYCGRFVEGTEASRVHREALGEDSPLKPLRLALLADRHYSAALTSSTRAFSQARHLNNRVDLQITLLREAHLKGRSFSAANAAEKKFLRERVAITEQGETPANLLISVLNNLRKDLVKAIDIARIPEFFFTCAQLHSVGGEILELHGVNNGDYWGSAKEVRGHSLFDLRVAESLGMPPSLFIDSEELRLGLAWAKENAEEFQSAEIDLLDSHHQ